MAGKTWRRTGTAVAVALLALSLAACNRGTSSTSTEGGGGEAGGKIAAVIKGLDNPFSRPCSRASRSRPRHRAPR
jgi:hypothetical protein